MYGGGDAGRRRLRTGEASKGRVHGISNILATGVNRPPAPGQGVGGARESLPRVTLGQARRMHLAAQGLLHTPRRRARPADLVAAVERMRLLQIDSIHVVARSPYLVLHARLGDYPPGWLDEALAQGQLAECWAHEASFVPAGDLARHRAWRERDGHWAQRHAARTRAEHPAAMEELLARIRREGPVRASDFPREKPASSGWWEWKPEKRWLEAWFALGELMVARRERFQRVYDVAERVLDRLDPPYRPSVQSAAQLRRGFILDAVRALGVAQARWIADYHRLRPGVTDAELAPMLASGELRAVQVHDWPERCYVHRDHSGWLEKALAGRLRATHSALLSPFDPVVWDRARAQALFGFEYTLECYTPQHRRRHGYFVLPILLRGELVGRLDAKAHRAEGVFEVKALFLQPGVCPDQRWVCELARTLAGAARWHGTPSVCLKRCEPAALARPLREALQSA